MAKLKKAIASLVACVLMISMLTLDVMAASANFPVGDATVTAYLTKSSTSATASISANKPGVNMSMSIVGTYYVRGTTNTRAVSNGNGGTTAATAIISINDGTLISVKAIFSATYGGYHNSVTLTE